jgi:hypothetical protein
MGWTIVHEDGSIERGEVRDDDVEVITWEPAPSGGDANERDREENR